jgi:alpha-beta hydrolase superfamily lysophospholipase
MRGAHRAEGLGRDLGSPVPGGSPNPSEETLYFASGRHTLFGWLHRPPHELTGDTGLVICKPFGYEAVCSHRSVRAFARLASELGLPALRFDYAGTGDSEDIDPRADQLEVWLRDVAAAIEELQRRTGVKRVCLLGFRLGALLATLAAARSRSVHGLVLVAPVLSGSGYLRELRVAELAASLAADSEGSSDSETIEREPASDGSVEASGFRLSAATVDSVSRIDVGALEAVPVEELLVIDRNDLPAARGWTEALRDPRPETRYVALPGFVEMMMRAPQFAVLAEAMIDETRDWLRRFQTKPLLRAACVARTPADDPIARVAVLRLAGADCGADAAITERPLSFGSAAALFGIVTEPRAGETRKRAVILLNAGADYHIGASRMYVSLARRWARRGYTVLRMDLPGLGDSDPRPRRAENEVFPPEAVDDVRAAVELLRGRYGVGDITLAGLCSGAYHALRAAVAGVAVNCILMVNPQTFFWRVGSSVDDIQMVEIIGSPRLYRERLLSAVHWRKLLAGQVDIWRIARVCMYRLHLALASTLRDLARSLHISLPHDLGSELGRIATRGVRTVMVFALGEPGIDLLRIQAGSSIKRFGERCRIHIIDSADHAFSRGGPRARLEDVLSRELFARPEPLHKVRDRTEIATIR